MVQIVIAPVTQDTISALDDALRALSLEMGDTHVATAETLEASFTGSNSAYNALLAFSTKDVVGALVWSPMFSTTRGGGGLYVSDLWVASSQRGQGTGPKLLAHAMADAETASGACFLRLSVHRTNPAALSFYARLGFEEEADMVSMILEGAALQTLIELQ